MKTSSRTFRVIEDYYIIHQARYAFILNKIRDLNLPEGARILDVGCFPQHLFKMLQDLRFEVYGVSSKHEAAYEKKIVSLNIETDKLPFKDNFFDLIIFTEIIEHLTLNPNNYMQKLKKILKKNGKLLITTPNAVNLKNRAKMFLGKNISFSLQQLYDTTSPKEIYFRHNREFTLEELEEVCVKSGFKISDSSHFNSYTPFRKGLNRGLAETLVKSAGFAITKFSPSLKDSLYILAVK